MSYYRFFKHELEENHVINTIHRIIEEENEKNKDFKIYKDSYVLVIGEEVAKNIFPSHPTFILGFKTIYETKDVISPMGIEFKNNSSAFTGKSCATCRFNERCPYVGICIDNSHWLKSTFAQKFEDLVDDVDTFSSKKLVGDITNGYTYVNPNTLNMPIMALQTGVLKTLEIKKGSIIEYNKMYDKKEDNKMKIKLYECGMYRGNVVTNPQDLIVDVIFSGPCTIVKWKDGDKTIVRCQEDENFDKEKGIAMCIVKKLFGTNDTKSNFNDIFKKWIPEDDDSNNNESPLDTISGKFKDALIEAYTGRNINHYTVKTYSEKFRISETKVRKMCREGTINAHKQDGAWIIDIKE